MGNATLPDESLPDESTVDPTIVFEPPGPGSWMLDTTHHGRRPLTPYFEARYGRIVSESMPVLLERYGMPIGAFGVAAVHGCLYLQPRPVPAEEIPLRAEAAAAAWREKRWRADVDGWFEEDGAAAVDANLALQRVDVGQLDDSALAGHLDEALENLDHQARRSFETHGGDMVPVGDLLAHCGRWGTGPAGAASLLAGSSPASRETAELLEPVSRALRAARVVPGSVAEVRALGPEVDGAVSCWLEQHGWRLVFSDDLDSPTLAEDPAMQLQALLAAGEPVPSIPPDASTVRARVPEDERELFDELLAEARYGMRLRDDNVGVRWNWPAGLVRRALLEIGRRLAARGSLAQADHVLGLRPDEVGPLLLAGAGPSADEVSRRWDERMAVIRSEPPALLGPPPEAPPFHLFPPALARAAAAIFSLIGAMQGEPSGSPLSGSGVGSRPYRGTARVLSDVSSAFECLEPGDVVVTQFTGPSWNSLLAVVGALVVEEGGPMCHAAIVARELGIPAVVGVSGATRHVPDGAEVEVDPIAGVVRVR